MAHMAEEAKFQSHRRVLVSGGAGFIGSTLTDHLLSRGDHVTVVDNLSTGRRHNLPASHPRLRVVEADLSKALDAFGPGERFDEIYHLAAAVGVKLVISEPIRSIEVNVDQTAALLRFAMTHGPGSGPARTLIASSSEVYGKSTKVPFAEGDDVVYGPTTATRWSYACSKAIDEFLALAYWQKQALPATIVRFFNTVGPRQVGEYGMVLPRFVGAALAGTPLQVYGGGRQTRCFCDARDSVPALCALMENPGAVGRVFNLGSDRVISIAELADLVVRTLNSRSVIEHVQYSDAYGGGFEDLLDRRPDLSRVREAIGWQPRISLEQTIADVAAWMRTGAGPV
jgi:UDP-glucose 4-epimerase